jgi:hypothetical protein
LESTTSGDFLSVGVGVGVDVLLNVGEADVVGGNDRHRTVSGDVDKNIRRRSLSGV